MSNAIFITCLFLFLQVWAGTMLGTALSKLWKGEFSFNILRSLLIGLVVACAPFLITFPAWDIIDVPAVPLVEAFIVLLAVGLPIFVPEKYLNALFGPRTYWIWLGLALISGGIYVLFQKLEMAQAVGLTALFAGAFAVRRGVELRTAAPHNYASPPDKNTAKKRGDL